MEVNPSEFMNDQQEAANESTPPQHLIELASKSTAPQRLIELARLTTDIAQVVANNPSAPANLLRELSVSSDATIRAHVAANPNTPTEVLLELGSEFPEQLLGNPIFSLLLLENPNLVEQIPLTTLRSILCVESVPGFFLEWAATHSDSKVQLAVATNSQTPKTVLEKLIQNPNFLLVEASPSYINWAGELVHSLGSQITEALHLHVKLAGEMTQSWDEAAREIIQNITLQVSQEQERGYALLELQKIGLIPDFILKHLCATKHPSGKVHYCYQVLLDAAKSANTPTSILEQFAQEEKLREAIAWNPNTPFDVLKELATDDNHLVRINIALSPHTPIPILLQLAQDDDAEVRARVAWNFNTPEKVLEQLAGQLASLNYSYLHTLEVNGYKTPVTIIEQMAIDRRSEVRKGVAKYRNTPAKILEKLADDEETGVRRMVALNVNTPFRVLLGQLARDADVGVRSAVAIRLNAINLSPFSILSATDLPQIIASLEEAREFQGAPQINSNDLSLESFLARDSNTLESLLQLLAHHENSSARRFVAQLPDAPLNLLEELAQDKEENVRLGVAMNQNAPVSLLEKLAKDEKDEIRRCVAKHPNTSFSILEQLFDDRKSSVRRVAVARYLEVHPEGLPVVLEHYAKNALPFFTRLLIFLHPKVPARILAENSRSKAWLERYAIAQNSNTSINTLTALAVDINRIVRAAARANLQRHTQQS
ncbi:MULTISPECIES: HEAT repeat domain-containing protein [unclassified Microcoleus]|uniref:HEAT repeat domain-containing protein n=1 Tax=unclassified Microcoleus TaxID=2642155 RepID=UPI002FD756B7